VLEQQLVASNVGRAELDEAAAFAKQHGLRFVGVMGAAMDRKRAAAWPNMAS
jgi:hypothetical protein